MPSPAAENMILSDVGVDVANYQYICKPTTPTPKWELLEYGGGFRKWRLRWVSGGGGKWRVREGGSGDRVHRVVGSLFGLAGKIPPEKFSGGGGWWPAAGELAGEEGGRRECYNGSTTGGKSLSILKRLLAGVVLNAKVRIAAVPTLPFIITSISTTPERNVHDYTDSVSGLNLRNVESSKRSLTPSILVMTNVTTTTTVVDLISVMKEKPAEPSPFLGGSHSTSRVGSSVGVYVPKWSVTNGSCLDNAHTYYEMVDEFAPPHFFALVCVERFDREERRGDSSLQAQLLLKEAEAIKAFQDAQIKIMEDKLAKLEDNPTVRITPNSDLIKDRLTFVSTKVVEAVLYLEETFCPRLLTTIASWRWLLTHGMKLVFVKYLNSPEYLSALGAFIGHAIEKGMQARLAAGINHGKEGKSLADVAAYNPFANADYDTAMQQFRDVNFSLLSELKSCKDTSVEEVMNLMVPILRFEDQVVLGSTSLSFSLSVLNSRVEKIRANIAAH
ncbi:hypothetical protein Tco_0679691, partial [Tanacetum coccineum]